MIYSNREARLYEKGDNKYLRLKFILLFGASKMETNIKISLWLMPMKK